ncbi:MAG: hypothetical protein SVU32_00125, partial [Candidatus Nanohaloarchaea archaeon]|nr:hypothetical protein [Candidatus Nanohaloarchaea archaeon]
DNRTKARKEVRKEIENAERSIVQLERFYENMKDLSSRLPAREQAVLRQQLADVNRTLNRSGRLLAEARERFASGAYEAAWRKAVRVQDRVGEARLRLERDRERLRSNLSQGLEKRIERLERRVERLNRTVNRLERDERVPPVAVRRVRNNLREAREALAAARRQKSRIRNASTSVEAVRMSSSVVERLERTSQNMRDAERVIETVRSPWYARPGFMWTALVVGAVLAVGGFLYYRFGDWWNEDENDAGETGEDAVEDEERN